MAKPAIVLNKKKTPSKRMAVLQPSTPFSSASPQSPILSPVLEGYSSVTPDRVYINKLSRFNPLRIANSPEVISAHLDQFASGYLRNFALTQEAIFNRDDVIVNTSGKRFGAITRRDIQVVIDDNAPEAEGAAQKQVLEAFYSSLKATNAIDLNVIGGTSLMVEQMLLAIGFKYVVHEIIWQPSPKGLSAIVNFVPLSMFENRTGKLRFLESDFAIEGVDLDKDWMITVGRGIMEACAVCYMFKHLPLKDWLIYSERHGMPGIQGKTKSAVDSPQWNAMKEAVEAVAMNFACVTSGDDEIEKLDFSTDGELPYPPLVDAMNRALASLWRGADLSTISSGKQTEGSGASLQGEESDIMEENDTRLINTALEIQLSRRVLEYNFGEGCPTYARAKIIIPTRVDVVNELSTITYMVNSGCEIETSWMHERFGIPEGKAGKKFLTPIVPPSPTEGGKKKKKEKTAANEAQTAATRALLVNSRALFAQVTSRALSPLSERIKGILELDDDALPVAVRQLEKDLPSILLEVNKDPANAKVLANVMSSAVFNGLTQAVVRRGQ